MSQNLSFENARIGWKNFSGAEGPYNAEGERFFSIFVEPERAAALEADGWNIKYPKPNENIAPEDDDRRPSLQVSIGMKFPPSISLLTHSQVPVLDEFGKPELTPDGPITEEEITSKPLDPENFGAMDFMEYTSVDIIVRPYNWSVNGKSGKKAYLKAMYVNMVVDEFQAKYGLDPSNRF